VKRDLAKLQKMELREVWGHEAIDFTRWLSQEENLSLLSEAIGVEIRLVQTEANVGRFNVDILAEEEGSGRKIIIENQLEDTNHDHLGKIITYAAGYDAEIIIWIVRNAREEHKKSIEWLNEHTDENISFFLINVELWQIGESNPAPKFDVIVSPNEWAKTIKTNASSGELTDTKLQQLEFWTRFKSYVRIKDTKLKLQTPRPQHWYSVSMGSSEAHIDLTVNTKDNSMGCEIYINNNKDLFNFFKDNFSDIEREIGQKPEWLEANKAARIKVRMETPDFLNQSKDNIYFDWLYKNIILFQQVFGKYIRQYKG
jgi:Domain of unknown function (DUF4268)